MQDLKDYRNKELKSYVIANIILLLYLDGYFKLFSCITDTTLELIKLFVPSFAGLSIFIVYIFVVDSLIPSKLKTKLVFWNKLQPGYKIFSEILEGKLDGRFTLEKVKNRYAYIYENMPKEAYDKEKYENDKWYSIYNNYRDNKMIEVSQRDYLLCRDLTVITLLLIVVYIAIYSILLNNCFNCKFLIFLILEYLVLKWVCYNKAERFVYNVIALDINNTVRKAEPKEFRVYLSNER